MRLFYIHFVVLFLIGCNSTLISGNNNRGNYRIRYINIDAIFDFLVKRDPKAMAVKQQKDKLVAEIQAGELKISQDANTDRGSAYRTRQAALQKLISEENIYKKKLLGRINTALRNVTTAGNIDFVLRLGEDTVYAKKEYDITEEVLREIIRLEKRSAPVTR